MKPPCAHIPTSDFKASPREWICSGCGKVGAWNDNWSYFGAIGCRKCGQEPVIEFVACSEACLAETRGWKARCVSVVGGGLTTARG
jgi:hypothetical protein